MLYKPFQPINFTLRLDGKDEQYAYEIFQKFVLISVSCAAILFPLPKIQKSSTVTIHETIWQIYQEKF